MAKCIDITDKLSFDKNPALIIKGRKFVVNADTGWCLLCINYFHGVNLLSIFLLLSSCYRKILLVSSNFFVRIWKVIFLYKSGTDSALQDFPIT